MKLNKILLLASAIAAFAFTSCDEDAAYTPGKAAQGTQLMGVTFGVNNKEAEELDPADPTTYAISVSRADSTEEVTIPLRVVRNEGDVFVVPENVTFKAGEKEAQIPVSFEKAAVGTKYTLEVGLAEDKYSNPYADNSTTTFQYSVTRVKWNLVGTATWFDDFWYGGEFEVELYQRDDLKSSYRFVSPYTDEFVEGAEEMKGTYQQYFVFNTSNGLVSWDDYFYINTMYDDEHEIHAFMQSYVTGNDADDANSYVKYNDDGSIRYFKINPYHYMLGLGGWSGYGYYLVFPGQPIPDELAGDDEEDEEEGEGEEGEGDDEEGDEEGGEVEGEEGEGEE